MIDRFIRFAFVAVLSLSKAEPRLISGKSFCFKFKPWMVNFYRAFFVERCVLEFRKYSRFL